MSREDDYPDYDSPGRGTRTRYAEGDADGLYPRGTPPRGGRAVSPSRGMVTVVGVVVLLIAAIAFANRGGGGTDDDSDARGAQESQPTAPTGERPVEGTTDGIPAGFPQTEQGAQSAAANYTVALGGDAMFQEDSRHAIIDALYEPGAAAELKDRQDRAYSADFLANLGLDAEGEPPSGQTFISRSIPIGTTIREFDDESATVAVWYTGLIGLAGEESTVPVRTTWHTWTFEMQWTGGDWKIISDTQKRGPAPVPGDLPAATDDEIEDAVEQYGGFTYAR